MKNERGSTATAKGAEGNAEWEKLRALPDSEIRFTADTPATLAADWAGALAHTGLPVPPRKTQIALRVDDDVLECFKAQGTGYQTRMNAVLRAFRDAHRHG